MFYATRLFFICNRMKFIPNTHLKVYAALLALMYITHLLYNALHISLRIDFVIITIYFLSIIRRETLNLFGLMIIGLLADQTLNLYIGTSALSYVLVAAIVNANATSLFKQKFSIVWSAFAVVLVLLLVAKFMLSIITGHQYQSHDLMSAVATFLIYPILHYAYCKYMIYEYKKA